MSISPEVGKSYRTASGDRADITRFDESNEPYVFVGDLGGTPVGHFSWSRTGAFCVETESALDLIALWDESEDAK